MKSRKWLLLIIIVLAVWIFRIELISWFQIQRLRSLHCKERNVEVDCFQKIWVHRVNSLERLKIVQQKFQGCEVDVVYDAKQENFWVYHYTDSNRHLGLESYLQAALKNNGKIWLDTRLVDSISAISALNLIEAWSRKYDVRKGVIFEMYDLRAANIFAEKGFIVSLNIPSAQLSNRKAIDSIRQSLSDSVPYVSQQSEYLKELENAFPDKKVLTWSLDFKNYFQLDRLQTLLEDDRVAVILVNYKSRYFH